MTLSNSRRILALILTLFTAAMSAVAPVAAAEQAIFSGRVLNPDGISPRDDVVVSLLNVETREVFSSSPTSDDGTFRIETAPPGSYRLAAETPEGAFVAPGAVDLQAGANKPLAFKLAPGATTPALAPAASSGGDRHIWEYVVGVLVFLGAVFVIDDAGENVEEEGSAF